MDDSSKSRSVSERPTVSYSRCATTRCWMFGRYVCCKYGWYPVVVALIITVGCLLSLYSATGCEYVELDVGFTPQPNNGWNNSGISLGFWQHYQDSIGDSADEDGESAWENIHDGCEWYSDSFDDYFIENDRTWNVARIMALIAGLGSTLAAIMAWLFVFTPVPVNCIWPCLFLPLVMVSFIAEGSKFLLFDISACRSNVWLPTGVNSLPQTAESCELGMSAYFGIAAGAVLLVGLVMVCVNVPNERELDPHFGLLRDEGSSQEETEKRYEEDEIPCNFSGASATGDGSVYTQDLYTADGDAEVSSEPDSDLKTPDISKSNMDDKTVVSESRLSTMAQVEKASQENGEETAGTLIEKLIQDLNCTYESKTGATEE